MVYRQIYDFKRDRYARKVWPDSDDLHIIIPEFTGQACIWLVILTECRGRVDGMSLFLAHAHIPYRCWLLPLCSRGPWHTSEMHGRGRFGYGCQQEPEIVSCKHNCIFHGLWKPRFKSAKVLPRRQCQSVKTLAAFTFMAEFVWMPCKEFSLKN